jgi:hypothetical protein
MTVSDIIALCGAATGFVATFYWYLASKVPIKAAWDYKAELKPKNMTEDSWGLGKALERAFMGSSNKNATAAKWTAISVGLSAVSVVLSKWHLIN